MFKYLINNTCYNMWDAVFLRTITRILHPANANMQMMNGMMKLTMIPSEAASLHSRYWSFHTIPLPAGQTQLPAMDPGLPPNQDNC